MDEGGRTASVEAVEREVALLLRRARTFSAQLAREVHPDVEAGAYALLSRLADTGGERLTDLAAGLGIGKPTASRQVAALEGLRLIERTADPDDARAQVLRLTDDGAARVHAARSGRRERFRELLGAWPAGDVEQLAALLHRFNRLDPTD